MKIYRGDRKDNRCTVAVIVPARGESPENSYLLPLARDVVKHSQEFNWGYGGSGPAQLAMAILVDSIGRELARECYQEFKADVIATIQSDRFQIDEIEIRRWLARRQRAKQ